MFLCLFVCLFFLVGEGGGGRDDRKEICAVDQKYSKGNLHIVMRRKYPGGDNGKLFFFKS